jgi:hypothetical protein
MNPLDRLLIEATAAVQHEIASRRGTGAGVWPAERGAADLRVLLAGTNPANRDTFRAGLTDRQRTVLGRFGARSSVVALRERSPERLRVGLIAKALADTNLDPRDLMVGVAVHFVVAQQLGLTPTEVFDEAASYAGAGTADVLRAFGRRTDVTLSAFGWQRIDTPDGPDITVR